MYTPQHLLCNLSVVSLFQPRRSLTPRPDPPVALLAEARPVSSLTVSQLGRAHELVDPVDDDQMPHEAVLWFQDPVVFIRKTQESALDAPHLQDVERRQALGNGQAEVEIVVNDQHRGVPVFQKSRWIPLVVHLLPFPDGP